MFNRRPLLWILAAAIFGTLSACGSDESKPETDQEPLENAEFQIRSANTDLILLEGDQNGLRIPLSLTRSNLHNKPVQLEVRGRTREDVAFVTSSFSNLTLTPSEDESEAVLKLSIADAPIRAQTREFIIVATDGEITDSLAISVDVQPTSAPDVYLLAGQSNMTGFSGDGTRQSLPGGADESNERIKQINVTKNEDHKFTAADDFTSESNNVIPPDIVVAMDPLHIPQDPNNNSGKDLTYIGLGLSFAKNALPNTSADIVLVPAAWSGSTFCNNSNGPPGNWMPEPTDNPDLGNTFLYDRAVARTNFALEKSGGVFRGILWHQGESDANERCAPLYTENLKKMVDAMRRDIKSVGNDSLRRRDATIPFVLGSMSRGVDEDGDFSVFPASKQSIDDAHRTFPFIRDLVDGEEVPIHAGFSDHDDLTPDNGFPCGNDSCIHFGPQALREMGGRYYQALLRALAQE